MRGTYTRVCVCMRARARALPRTCVCEFARVSARDYTRERRARSLACAHERATAAVQLQLCVQAGNAGGGMEAAWWAHSLPGLCSFSLSFSFLFRLTRAISSSFSFCSPAGLSPSLPRRSPRHPSLLSPSVVPPNRYLLFLSSSNAFHLVAPCPASSVLFSVPVSPSLSLRNPRWDSLSLLPRGEPDSILVVCCVSLRLPILFLCLSVFSSVYLRLSSPTIVFLILED